MIPWLRRLLQRPQIAKAGEPSSSAGVLQDAQPRVELPPLDVVDQADRRPLDEVAMWIRLLPPNEQQELIEILPRLITKENR